MAIDNLPALLPDPPPPRPARREAAIEEALRRFDAGGQSVSPAPVAPSPARRFEGWGRPQIAALASVALVVLVSVPIWWAERDRIAPQVPPLAAPTSAAVAGEPAPPAPQQSAPAAAATVPASSGPSAPGSPAAPIAARDAPSAAPAAPPAPAASADASASAALEVNLNRLPAFTPAPSPADASARGQASGRAAAKSAPAPPPPPPAAARRHAAEAGADRQIVITGSRIARPSYESNSPTVSVDESFLQSSSTTAIDAGDWNDCTLLDPRRDANACRAFADPSAPGDTGRAAAQLADGLSLAWQGNLDRAIDAFDRAIRAAPDLSIAYLNRGLAWQAKGDLGRALGDLNRAVARDPGNARAYYHRSQLHRARGDTARAEADARRAAELGAR